MIGELFGALEEDLETFSPCWLLNKNYEGKVMLSKQLIYILITYLIIEI